jgi:hypothetical protein
MRTTVEIPDALFRRAKATAAERGVSLEDLLIAALKEHLHPGGGDSSKRGPAAPSWMSAFGGLRHLHEETKRINQILQQEFGQLG